MIDDAGARERALDPATSFAVRAPAGSGKTSLLTQRLLRLLATVEHPEQIVAITFTRKAAEEMRTRVIGALQRAAGPPPEQPFERRTHALAAAARAHDARQGWQLAAQPARLRIMTIDALCQSLVRQMPVTARLPGLPAVEEEPQAIYDQAARDALATITQGGDLRAVAARVLSHADNDWSRLERLLADMLGKRDQWFRGLAGRIERGPLDRAFERILAAELEAVNALLPDALGAELVALGAWAGSHLDDSPLADLAGLPPPTPGALPAWQALAALFLTTKDEWRKSVNKNNGFPTGSETAKAMKARWVALAERLREVPRLRKRLARLRQLPARAFGDDEWTVVGALLRLMLNATVHLEAAFVERGRSDYTAFALAALEALGEPEAPTDLALALDYQVRHLLVDEFQDTSITQYLLIERLTAGWSADDGRTLFLVGDPMQSIYRFRQADVSLFRRVLDQQRIGSVPLSQLALTVNFRAQAALVDWVNDAVPRALDALEASAQHFVTQTAERAYAGPPIALHAFEHHDARAEAAAVCAIVEQARAERADASIAVLVRSRTHLGEVAAALLDRGIAVAAREIRPFTEQPVVADLIALTRALLHPADRIAWFAVLRAPWCGLRLASLHLLATAAPTVPEACASALAEELLDADEHARLARAWAVLGAAFEAARSIAPRALVESTWVALGGPALHGGEPQALRDARALLDLLDQFERDGQAPTARRIESRLARRYSSPPGAAAGAVQIMTMHGAKGLEFDVVILPGLGRPARAEDRPLLYWRDEIDAGGQRELLLAPLPVTGESPLYEYLRARDKEEAEEEGARLLYVALTRARERVHLLGHAAEAADGSRRPSKGTLLAMLWPTLADDFDGALERVAARAAPDPVPPAAQPLRRADPAALPPPAPRPAPAAPVAATTLVEFDWAGATARHLGTVTHRLLQYLGAGPVDDAARARALTAGRGELRALGVPPGELDAAVDDLARALDTTRASKRGRWLFDPAHVEARAELCLADAGAGGGRLVIDRTFVDADGVRWIVDFKTGTHAGGGLDAWLDREVERYRPQLDRYARTMALLETRPIRLGLYFPLLDAWREWAWPGA